MARFLYKTEIDVIIQLKKFRNQNRNRFKDNPRHLDRSDWWFGQLDSRAVSWGRRNNFSEISKAEEIKSFPLAAGKQETAVVYLLHRQQRINGEDRSQ
ncbi:unnamed protein product [Citrullus colocynthis]|uniref:Ycf15 n=1 Tax=Citrullus colocynthis TaxID=252529 RepID=A0ABP0YH39_9ROSI